MDRFLKSTKLGKIFLGNHLITPLLVKIGDALAVRIPVAAMRGEEVFHFSVEGTETSVRALVAGYGRVGHAVGAILASSEVPWCVRKETRKASVAASPAR